MTAREQQPQPCAYIHASNLKYALTVAVKVLKERDAAFGPTFRSAQRVGLESNIAAMEQGQTLQILP